MHFAAHSLSGQMQPSLLASMKSASHHQLRFGSMLLALAILFLESHAACPPGDCKPFGECVLDDSPECRKNGTCEERCVCHDGFSGRDCSFLMELCPTDSGERDSFPACYNGGTCYPEPHAPGTGFSWRCDCSAAGFGDAIGFRGNQCEFPSETISCEIGKETSDYAFCVNDGSCGDNEVESGQVFHGCTCSSLFEGRHCQFPAGSSPEQEFLMYSTNSRTGLGAGTIVVFVLVALVGMGGLVHIALVARRHRQAERSQSQKVGIDIDAPLEDKLEEVALGENQAPPAVGREII